MLKIQRASHFIVWATRGIVGYHRLTVQQVTEPRPARGVGAGTFPHPRGYHSVSTSRATLKMRLRLPVALALVHQ